MRTKKEVSQEEANAIIRDLVGISCNIIVPEIRVKYNLGYSMSNYVMTEAIKLMKENKKIEDSVIKYGRSDVFKEKGE